MAGFNTHVADTKALRIADDDSIPADDVKSAIDALVQAVHVLDMQSAFAERWRQANARRRAFETAVS